MSEVCPACGFSGDLKMATDVDLTGRKIRIGEKWVRIPGYQWDLFYMFYTTMGQYTHRDRIFLKLYGTNTDIWPNENTINVFICQLRGKLKGSRFVIENQHGIGYRMVISPVQPQKGHVPAPNEPLPMAF